MLNLEVAAHQVTDPDAYPSTHASTHEDAKGLLEFAPHVSA